VSNSWSTANFMAPPSGGVEIDYGRLTRALLAARPIYGDVHVQDGYGGFRREMEQDRRRAALGSVAPHG
jgi:hypothetical protein